MKKVSLNLKNIEIGQILPIFVFGMVVMIALAALILDGGVLMANRRSAQAAADAGALAGARLSCLDKTKAEIEAEALHYAIDLNKADPSTTASFDFITGLVTVQAKMEQNSWFAKIFGEDTLSAGAKASAGCYYPSIADRILPIAFYYKSPPVDAANADCNTDGSCNLVNWNFDDLMSALSVASPTSLPLDDIYVVANSTKVCEKSVTGTIVCSEMDGNAAGGNRTWIDLRKAGLTNTGDLKKIVTGGIDEPLDTPAWINGQPGTDSAVYTGDVYLDLDAIPGYASVPARLLYVPLFDLYCPLGSTCQPDPDPVYDINNINDYVSNPNQPAYRFVGFAPFIITCVTKSDKCEFGQCIPADTFPNTTSKPICPGYLASNSFDDKNAIEGYFVGGLPTDMTAWGTEGVDAGLYIISLSD